MFSNRMFKPARNERNLYWADRRLQRDVWITDLYLQTHHYARFSKLDDAHMNSAAAYREWCRHDGSWQLDQLPASADLDPFIQTWRHQAVAADIRGVPAAARRAPMAIIAALIAGIAFLKGAVLVGAIAGGIAVALALSVWFAKSVLLVGPEAPPYLSDLVIQLGRLPISLHSLVFRLANFRRI